MKNAQLKRLFLAATLAALPVAVIAAGSSSSAEATEAKSPAVVRGKVEAKSDSSLTVGGPTLKLTGTTAFTRAGAPVTREDVKVGDEVAVTTAEDGETATTVEIMMAG